MWTKADYIATLVQFGHSGQFSHMVTLSILIPKRATLVRKCATLAQKRATLAQKCSTFHQSLNLIIFKKKKEVN
jgi:hypothetical protein